MESLTLELNTREREVLVPELESVIRELSGIIASGIKKDARDEMKQERDMLRAIVERLKIEA